MSKGLSAVKTLTALEISKKWKLPLSVVSKRIADGTKVEKEHTTSIKQAAEIARDHLGERPDYYEKLDRMEKTKVVKEMNLGNQRLSTNVDDRRSDERKADDSKVAVSQDKGTSDGPSYSWMKSGNKSSPIKQDGYRGDSVTKNYNAPFKKSSFSDTGNEPNIVTQPKDKFSYSQGTTDSVNASRSKPKLEIKEEIGSDKYLNTLEESNKVNKEKKHNWRKSKKYPHEKEVHDMRDVISGVHRGRKVLNHPVPDINEEQLNELNPGTLGSYIRKASDSRKKALNTGTGKADIKTWYKRQKGIETAVKKLTREETTMDTKEHINEALDNILQNNLQSMKDHLTVALQEKAIEKLEERKKIIAAEYFAQ